MKRKYKVTTHLRDEYRWAFSPVQALYLVYSAYRRIGLRRSFKDCETSWSVSLI